MAAQVVNTNIISSTTPRQSGAPCSATNYNATYDPVNGNVTIATASSNTSTNLASGCATIFSNGTFTSQALSTYGQSTLNSIYSSLVTSVTSAHSAAGGNAGNAILPTWTSSTTPSVAGSSSSSGTQSVSSAVAETNSQLQFASANAGGLFSNPALLVYPLDILSNQQDTLRITQYRYQVPTQEIISGNPGSILTEGLQRNTALQEIQGQVILPVPNNISDANSVSWGPDTMNNLTAAATAEVMSNTKAAAAGAAFDQLLTGGKVTPLALYGTLLTKALSSGGTNSAAKRQVEAAVASLVLKAGQFEVPPETILARGFGVIPNSNLELLFNSPVLRDFQFSWKLTPRSSNEAKNVRRIIRFFKQGMAVRKLGATAGAGSGSVFLGTPNVFKLQYKTIGGAGIKGLNKFKICALTGFTVNYTPDGQWQSYIDSSAPGQPVSYSVTAQFNEIEPVYESDYQETVASGLQDNLESISSEDIGY